MATRTRHVPVRRCVACGAQRPKRELVRVVRTPYGDVKVDKGGRESGRGAYLCPDPQCWAEGLKPKKLGRLEYALRSRIRPEDKETLLSFARSLVEDTAKE